MRIELKTPWQRKQFLFFALLWSCGWSWWSNHQQWGAICLKGPSRKFQKNQQQKKKKEKEIRYHRCSILINLWQWTYNWESMFGLFSNTSHWKGTQKFLQRKSSSWAASRNIIFRHNLKSLLFSWQSDSLMK